MIKIMLISVEVTVPVLPGGQLPVLVPVQQEEDLLAVRDLGGGQRQS